MKESILRRFLLAGMVFVMGCAHGEWGEREREPSWAQLRVRVLSPARGEGGVEVYQRVWLSKSELLGCLEGRSSSLKFSPRHRFLLVWSVGARGVVEAPSVEGATFLSRDLEDCLAWAASTWRFSARMKGRDARVEIYFGQVHAQEGQMPE